MAETQHSFCDPLRQQLKAVDDEIASLDDMLSFGDLPPQQRAPARERLQKLRALRPQVAGVATQCEATFPASPAPAPGPNPPS